MANDKLIFPIGFDLEKGVAQVEKDWGKMQKRLQDTFKSQTIQVNADISKAVLDKLYAKFEGLIKTMESKAPQIKLKIPDTVDFEQEINRLKVQLKSINLGELTDAESKDLYLYIRQLEALAKALKEVNKQEQLRQANRPEVIALRQAQAEEKRTRALANSALAEQRRAKIATESARQDEINNRKKMRASVEQARIDEINNRSAQRDAVIAEQKRAATARAENAELRLTQAKQRSTDATHEQNAAYKTQSSYLSRLMQRMVAYASVAQALSFLRNIKDVTAEFEMQRVSLGALIQDAQKANMIFEQIKMQAVKSPYEVQDLVRYTKQLAAYGVEADELISTMNQLADISAGLGTEMDRIILAYGQIQAAGVLKGTELKQLTELGLPMVELLADYYSTLRDEVVTTSEVFDMMSNKEIPFEDVQAVLEALTSEGGRFYEMQATQAETLQGSWANLKDTLSLMFDEIGRSEEVQGLLRGFIDLTKALARNWNEIWQAIKVVGLTYGSLKVGATIMRVIRTTTMTVTDATLNYMRATRHASTAMANQGRIAGIFSKRLQYVAWWQLKAAKASNVLTRSFYKLGAVIMANPVAAITTLVGVIAGFVAYTKSAGEEVKTFEDEQKEYYDGVVKDIGLTVDKFKKLAQMAVTYAEGSEKQQQALQNLKDQFGDMFPEYQLTLEYLRGLVEETGNVSTAFDSMGQSIQASMAAKLRQDLIDKEYERMNTEFANLFDMAREGDVMFIDDLALMIEYIEQGSNQLEAMKKVLGDLEVPNAVLSIDGNRIFTSRKKADELVRVADARRLKLRELSFYDLKASLSMLKESDEWRQDMEALYNYLQSLRAFSDRIKGIKEDTAELEGNYARINRIIESAQNLTSNAAQYYIDDSGGLLFLEVVKESLSDEEYDEIRTKVQKYFGDLVPTIDQFMSRYSNGKFFGKALSDEAIYGINELKKVFGIYDDEWRNFLSKQAGFVDGKKIRVFTNREIENFGSLYDAVEKISKAYEDTYKTLKKYKKLRSETDDAKAIAIYDEQIVKLEEQNRQRKAFLDEYGSLVKSDKDDNKTLKERQTLLKDELSTVEKIYKEYQGLRKYMSEADAQATINKMFGSVSFEFLGMATSFEEMREQLNKALKEAKRLGDTKLAMDIEYKIGKMDADEIQKNMEKELKRLSDQLSRTKTAKEFFDKMLGLTGDKQLSATLTLSVYGTTGDDLQKLMTQQVTDAFKGVDITSAMLGGGKFDYNILANLVDNLPEAQRQNAQSIVDNWRKANADILTDLQKSYKDFMTYEERKTRVAQKYVSERKKIEESLYDKNEKEELMRASREAEKKELGAIAIEEFKASDDWIKSFEDLGNLATPTIERLMTKLKEFITLNKEAFTSEQLKSLMGEYDKLYNGLITRNPIQAITDSIKEYKTALQGVKLAQSALDAAKAMGDEDLIAWAERGLTDAFDDARKATSKLQKGLSELGDKFSQAQKFVSSFTETLGISEDTQFGAFLNGISDALGGVSKAFAFAQLAVQLFDGTIKTMLASNPIGWILLAVSAIISAVQAIANARVKRIDQDIERLDDRLDSLSYAYDRLQKAQEKAFGTEYIQNYQRQLDNLEAQQEAYLKQAELERSKGKKADEEKIKEYEEQARNTADAIKDMYGSLSEHFLGQDLASAARDFASAWIEAYKEFSNTTDAMKAKFQDMIQNMVVESLLAKVMERALEPVFTMIDEMQAEDFYSTSFWQRVMATMQTATENGVVGAENVMSMLEQMGINLRGLGGEMTGISRDIATASEESILGLAAGINTQNFYISQVPTKLDTIIGLLRGDGAIPQGSAMTLQDVMIAQNQFLSHLPTIAKHTADTVAECKQIVVETRRTADALDRVIKPKGTQTTHTLNTTIN